MTQPWSHAGRRPWQEGSAGAVISRVIASQAPMWEMAPNSARRVGDRSLAHHQSLRRQLRPDRLEQLLRRRFVLFQHVTKLQLRGGIRHRLPRPGRSGQDTAMPGCQRSRHPPVRPNACTPGAPDSPAASAPFRSTAGCASLSGSAFRSVRELPARGEPVPSRQEGTCVASAAYSPRTRLPKN